MDWGERHHDLCLLDQDGRVLGWGSCIRWWPPRQQPGQVGSGDAKVLAELVRIDRHNHRQVAGDSPLAEAVKVLARAHQSLIWARQRHVNALREFYPATLAALGAQLAEPEALAVLELAPSPEQGRRLTRAAIRRALVQAGRRRNLQTRVVAVHDGLAAPQLAAPAPIEAA